MPASNSRKQNGVQCQMSTMMTDSSAMSRLPSQSCGARPINAEDLVDEAEIEVEHQLPDRADDDARDQDRQDEDRAVEDAAACDLAAQERQQQTQDHLARHRATAKINVLTSPARNSGSAGKRRVVRQADTASDSLPPRPGHVLEARDEEVHQRQQAQQRA